MEKYSLYFYTIFEPFYGAMMIIAGIVILFLGGRFIFFFMPIVVIDLTLLFFTFILEFFNYFQNLSKNAVIFLIIPGIIGFIGVIVSVIS